MMSEQKGNMSLSNSIFGNMNQSTSLTNSIFGAKVEEKNESKQPIQKIFDNENSARFLDASNDLQQKHVSSMKKRSLSLSDESDCHDKDESIEDQQHRNKDIFEMRKRRQKHPSSSKACKYITFDLSQEGARALKILDKKSRASKNEVNCTSKTDDDSVDENHADYSNYLDSLGNLSVIEREKLIEEEELLEAITAVRTIFEEMGVTVLKSGHHNSTLSDDRNHSTTQLFPPDLMKKMVDKARKIEFEVCQRLDEKGDLWRAEIPPENQKKIISSKESNQKELEHDKNRDRSPFNWRYQEVACRCPGRLDVRYKMDQPPFNDPRITNNPFLAPLIQNLLGGSVKKSCEGSLQNSLIYAGLIFSFPGSSDQPWHMDGTTLFPEEKIDLPPYALNVFVPLNDVTPDIGPTEFLPASHLCGEAEILENDLLAWVSGTSRDQVGKKKRNKRNNYPLNDNFSEEEWMNRNSVMAPQLKVGDALIYDYRVCHRGTKNLSESGKTRTMLYLLFARPWFKEHLNFGGDYLFSKEGSDEK